MGPSINVVLLHWSLTSQAKVGKGGLCPWIQPPLNIQHETRSLWKGHPFILYKMEIVGVPYSSIGCDYIYTTWHFGVTNIIMAIWGAFVHSWLVALLIAR